MPKLMACGPRAASIPARVRGNGFGTAWIVRSSVAAPAPPALSVTRAIGPSLREPRLRSGCARHCSHRKDGPGGPEAVRGRRGAAIRHLDGSRDRGEIFREPDAGAWTPPPLGRTVAASLRGRLPLVKKSRADASGPALQLPEPRQDLLGEEPEALRRLAVGHEARAARQHEVLERPDPLAVLPDLPVDAVRVPGEHQALRHRLLRGDADQTGGGPRGGGDPGPRLRRVERGRERGRNGPGQELRVLRRGAQPGVEEPE